MKRFFAAFSVFIFLLFSGCAQKDLIDIYTFSDRFSEYNDFFEIDTKNLIAKEDGDHLAFPLNFSDKFLLTVYVNPDTSLITSLSVTYAFKEHRKISNEDFISFLKITESAVKAFTDFSETEAVLSKIGLADKDSVLKNNHNSAEEGFYKFSFLSDEIGIYFTASTERR